MLLLEAAEESLATGRPVDRHIQQALRSARDNLAESRRVVWALRPRPLAEQPLPQALQELTGRLAEETGLPAETVVTGTARPLPAHVEEALLRVGQEALANVRKHAAASRVTVTLSYLEDVVTLDVHDDGVGFDLEQSRTDRWVFRRHSAVSRPLHQVGVITADGVPVVAPETALLFKAKAPRFKDQRDFDRVLPHLDRAARSWLASALEQACPGHPWHARVTGEQA